MRVFYYVLMLAICCSCNRAKLSSVNEGGLVIQASEMKALKNEKEMTLRVRILLPSSATDIVKAVGKKMQYSADSCFSLYRGNVSSYPLAVEPVANGIANSFEYLLVFDSNDDVSKKELLVYQDRYINQKKYQLIIQ